MPYCPVMLLRYCLGDFEMVSVVPVIIIIIITIIIIIIHVKVKVSRNRPTWPNGFRVG